MKPISIIFMSLVHSRMFMWTVFAFTMYTDVSNMYVSVYEYKPMYIIVVIVAVCWFGFCCYFVEFLFFFLLFSRFQFIFMVYLFCDRSNTARNPFANHRRKSRKFPNVRTSKTTNITYIFSHTVEHCMFN